MSVDDLVGGLFRHLEALGEEETLAVFASDNGFLWGEHGLRSKGLPYTEAVKVPPSCAGRAVAAGRTDPRLAAGIDIAPTVLSATGVAPASSLRWTAGRCSARGGAGRS